MITKQTAEEIACRDFGSKLGTVMRFIAALDDEHAFPDEATLAEIARGLAEVRETIKDGLEDRIKCHLEDCVTCTRRRAENQTALAWLNRVARLLRPVHPEG